MSSGRRRTVFLLLVAACTIAAVAAVATSARQDDPTASAATRGLLTDPHPLVIFRSLEGDPTSGRSQLAVAKLDHPERRTLTALRCDRVHYAAGAGICLARGGGFASGYRAKVFGADLRVRHEIDVAGVPSRARVAPDGRYGSVTLFVTGHSYSEAGGFSTETTLIDLARGKKIADLEEFTVMRGGKQVTAVDVNFWGVTFARESDRFYATMATGGKTYLIEGSVKARTAHVIHENVECPSLSPDGTRVAYKKRVDNGTTTWRLAVLDLTTMRETVLAETRPVDDQAEWLDAQQVLYGVDGEVAVVPADGSGQPRRFLGGAESPAVVRP